jgi:hypothetical protein
VVLFAYDLVVCRRRENMRNNVQSGLEVVVRGQLQYTRLLSQSLPVAPLVLHAAAEQCLLSLPQSSCLHSTYSKYQHIARPIMRLIKTDSKEVIETSSDSIPPYVILSHTWSRVDGDEVTFQDMTMSPEKAKKKPGYAKIDKCCAKALEDQFDYVWIDTCW